MNLAGLSLSLSTPRGGGAASAAYSGFVATRCGFCNIKSAANKQIMSRSPHVATDSITALRIALANFIITNSSDIESGNGAATDVVAYVEYPAATLTPILWGGSATGTLASVPSGGPTTEVGVTISDLTSVTIPLGATFWIRVLTTNAVGILYQNGAGFRDAANGALLKIQNATTWTSTDLQGTITQSVANTSYAPAAIIGTTTKGSVAMLGDSIMFGFGDTDVADRRMGMVAKNLPADTVAFVNLSGGGARSDTAFSRAVGRSLLLPYCSSFFSNLGINDSGLSAATTKANLETIATGVNSVTGVGLRSATKKYAVTITPRGASSTDGWTTVANQTSHGSNGTYQAVSDYMRATLTGYTGFCEVTRGVLESSLNSGKWICTPTPPYTGDGLHPNAAGYTLAAPAITSDTYADPT